MGLLLCFTDYTFYMTHCIITFSTGMQITGNRHLPHHRLDCIDLECFIVLPSYTDSDSSLTVQNILT